MAVGTLTPSPYQTTFDANGDPVNGAKINTYLAGTLTPVQTFSDGALTVANTNPIIADSAGRWVAYLTPGVTYKFVITTSAGVAIRTVDNIVAVPASTVDTDVAGTTNEGFLAGEVGYLDSVSSRWSRTDSDAVASSTGPAIVGVASQAISSGQVGNFRIAGRVTGLSGLTTGSKHFVGPTPGALVATPPTNRRFVGVADSATSIVVFPNFVDNIGVTITTSTGTQNNWTIAQGLLQTNGITAIKLNNASLLTITGLAGGVDGAFLELIAVGAGQVNISNLSGSSSAANQIANNVTGTISMVDGRGRVLLVYDGAASLWRVVTHEQGNWITPTFAAGNFTASGSMTWIVASGDVTTYKYYLKGSQLTIEFYIDTTTVGGTPSTELRIAIPGGFLNGARFKTAIVYQDNAGTVTVGIADTGVAGATTIALTRSAGGNWTAATDATVVSGCITIEVQ